MHLSIFIPSLFVDKNIFDLFFGNLYLFVIILKG